MCTCNSVLVCFYICKAVRNIGTATGASGSRCTHCAVGLSVHMVQGAWSWVTGSSNSIGDVQLATASTLHVLHGHRTAAIA